MFLLFCIYSIVVAQEEFCDDRFDDDLDDLMDCHDNDCATAAVCLDERLFCRDGKDNDNNQQIDCADFACLSDPFCVGCANAPLVWSVDVFDFEFEHDLTAVASLDESSLLARTKLPYLSMTAFEENLAHFTSIAYPASNTLVYGEYIAVRANATISLVAGNELRFSNVFLDCCC